MVVLVLVLVLVVLLLVAWQRKENKKKEGVPPISEKEDFMDKKKGFVLLFDVTKSFLFQTISVIAKRCNNIIIILLFFFFFFFFFFITNGRVCFCDGDVCACL